MARKPTIGFAQTMVDSGAGALPQTSTPPANTPPATTTTTTTTGGGHAPTGSSTAMTGSSGSSSSSSSSGSGGLTGVSGGTAAQLAQYEAGWTPSDNVNAAMEYLEQVNSGRPNPYTSQYDAQIQEAYNAIMNRDPFRYDLRTDTLYQQYKDQYMTNGRQAMMDTMGAAAGLTGGYNSTYSQTAGQQTYDSYLAQLNNLVPELYDRAFNRYQYEGQEMLNRLNLATGMDDRDYGRWRDTYNDWLNEREYAYNMYGTERQFDYGMWSDMLSYWADKANAEQAQANWQAQFNASHSGGSGGSGRRGSSSGSSSQELWNKALDYANNYSGRITSYSQVNEIMNTVSSRYGISKGSEMYQKLYAMVEGWMNGNNQSAQYGY